MNKTNEQTAAEKMESEKFVVGSAANSGGGLTLEEAEKLISTSEPIALTDGRGTNRVVFRYTRYFVVVKMFPGGAAHEKWSVKFYFPMATLAMTMTTWNTSTPIDDANVVSSALSLYTDVIDTIIEEEST